MPQLQGKRILLGISGSISAYKAADLCRLLVKEGAQVKVVMTPSATTFISPLTLSTLSKNPVGVEMVNDDHTWNNHVELGLWADLILIAPASANTITALATGQCTNLLSAVYLSARSPVMIAPAMDHDMFLHPTTTEHLALLKSRGHAVVGPSSGELASGIIGTGRLMEPTEIIQFVVDHFFSNAPLKGIKILVTAGPTREAIDPVRYISNHSTGKMGIAIAENLAANGAEVTLVAGPVSVPLPHTATIVKVESADQMLHACLELFPVAQVVVMTAAVADYKPAEVATSKIKKKVDQLLLPLVPTPDILTTLGGLKKADQVLVGFALETDNELENAKAKLKKKNLDLIVLNSLKDEGAGFASDLNKVTFIAADNSITTFPLKSKSDVARDLTHHIIQLVKHA